MANVELRRWRFLVAEDVEAVLVGRGSGCDGVAADSVLSRWRLCCFAFLDCWWDTCEGIPEVWVLVSKALRKAHAEGCPIQIIIDGARFFMESLAHLNIV